MLGNILYNQTWKGKVETKQIVMRVGNTVFKLHLLILCLFFYPRNLILPQNLSLREVVEIFSDCQLGWQRTLAVQQLDCCLWEVKWQDTLMQGSLHLIGVQSRILKPVFQGFSLKSCGLLKVGLHKLTSLVSHSVFVVHISFALQSSNHCKMTQWIT